MDELLELKVSGIECEVCAQEIMQALSTLDGVGAVEVDLARSWVAVRFDPTTVDRGTVALALCDAGYPADPA